MGHTQRWHWSNSMILTAPLWRRRPLLTTSLTGCLMNLTGFQSLVPPSSCRTNGAMALHRRSQVPLIQAEWPQYFQTCTMVTAADNRRPVVSTGGRGAAGDYPFPVCLAIQSISHVISGFLLALDKATQGHGLY